MNDRAVNLLEQYDIEILKTRKGRGAILCESSEGCLIFKEYTGKEEKLHMQNNLLNQLQGIPDIAVERIYADREGKLFVRDFDGTRYILKGYLEGRECNINDRQECRETIRVLARLHHAMECDPRVIFPQREGEKVSCSYFSPAREYEKRNRELKKVRAYLKKRSQKTWFEIELSRYFDAFLDQGFQLSGEWESYEEIRQSKIGNLSKMTFCHGDYQYHNLMKGGKNWFVANFEKCIADDPIRDLYLMMRKLLEKSGWSVELGRELLKTYEEARPLSALSFIDLYYRMAYPEKFWKIVNFYYNSGKAWIPGKNLEKLERVVAQEQEKQHFLDEIFRGSF